jgi:hypothetical protein
MRVRVVNALQQMFWSVYITCMGIHSPEQLRRLGLL